MSWSMPLQKTWNDETPPFGIQRSSLPGFSVNLWQRLKDRCAQLVGAFHFESR